MHHVAHLQMLAAQVGQRLATSRWVAVEQQRIADFADATEDRQWIHLDAGRAASGPFGSTIAHGFLTLSLLPAMLASALRIADVRIGINYGLNKVRFPAPVPAGARIRAHFKLLGYDPLPDGAQLTIEATIERDGGAKPVCVAELLTRHHV